MVCESMRLSFRLCRDGLHVQGVAEYEGVLFFFDAQIGEPVQQYRHSQATTRSDDETICSDVTSDSGF